MFRNLKIRHKLVLLGALLSLPAFILLFFFVQEKNKAVAVAEQERAGNAYIRPLWKIVETVPQFERGGLPETAARVDEAFAELDSLTQQQGANFGTEGKLVELRAAWQNLKTNRETAAPEKHQELYRAVMQNAAEMCSLVGYSSQLVLDQDVAGFYTADAMLVRLPEQVRLMAELTQLGDRIVANRAATPDEKLQMSIWLGLLETNAADLNADYEQALRRGNWETMQAVESALKKHIESLQVFAGMLRQKISQASEEDLRYASAQHFNTVATNAMTANGAFWRDLADVNQTMLTARISRMTTEKYAALGAFLLVGLCAALLAWLTIKKMTASLDEAVEISDRVSRGEIVTVVAGERNDEIGKLMQAMARMTVYLTEMAEISDRIAGGNLSVQVEPKSAQDRFGNSFQNMLARTLRLVQSQEDRDRLQNSIMKLLSDVADVASGDLRAQAEVTPDMTGAIADAFNFMIEELRSIISQVQTTTFEVDSSAERVQTATEDLVLRSETQSAQIVEVSKSIEKMVASVQQIADSVTTSVQVADNALENAKRGTSAVQSNVSAMNRLREQATETAARIRKLGERSEEIVSIVKLIDDVARRANILALNATIQASAAGEKGRGFIVVAQEVERLAERSSDATRAINALTQAIQGETSEAVAAIEETLREVSVGARVASEVASAVAEIEIVSNRLSELSRIALEASHQQAEGSESIHRAIGEIASIAQQTAVGMRQSASTVTQLAVSARELRTSLASFKLPEDADAVNPFAATMPSLN